MHIHGLIIVGEWEEIRCGYYCFHYLPLVFAALEQGWNYMAQQFKEP